MPRLFAGLPLSESERLRLSLLRGPIEGARWVLPENYHVTLRFFGDVENHVADDLVQRLGEIYTEAFSFRISGLGSFGNRKPRAVWAGVSAGPQLAALQQATERAAQRAGLEAEARKFIPHVTLARLRGVRPSSVARFLEEFSASADGPPMHARSFSLFSSRPGTGGGLYVTEMEFPLSQD